jgi:hypothetical protein
MLNNLRLESLVVAEVLFMSLFVTMVVDGTLDSFFTWKIMVWPASVALCEWLLRLSRGSKTVTAVSGA